MQPFLFSLLVACALCQTTFASSPSTSEPQKLYFYASDIELSDHIIYIHLQEKEIVETNTLRSDEKGLFIFANDITGYSAAKKKLWKCPYCNHWWPVGQKCSNNDCPTNLW